MFHRLILFGLTFLSLAACEEKRGDPFFRYWAATDGTHSLNLVGGKLEGTESDFPGRISIAASDGSSCSCYFWVRGGYDEGTYSISQCIADVQGAEAYCSMNQAGSYTSDLTVLTLCPNDDPDECRTYK